MKMGVDLPLRKTHRRRQRRPSRRRQWFVRPKRNRLTRFCSTIISVCRRRQTRWAGEKLRKPRPRQRRRLSCRSGLRRSSCRTTRFARLSRFHKSSKTSCLTLGSWPGLIFRTIIWNRSRRTCSSSLTWRRSTFTATTSRTWTRRRSWTASKTYRVWPSMATRSRPFKTIDSGSSASCTPTMRICAVWTKYSWQTESSTRC